MQRLNATQIAQLIGSEAYIGGLLDPHGGNIHPLNYALGLADAALAAGAQIYGQSKVQTVTQDGDVHLLTTARGSLCARKVLVCTNGYTGDLIPGLRQTVVPIRSVQVLPLRCLTTYAQRSYRDCMCPPIPGGCSLISAPMRRGALSWGPVAPIRPVPPAHARAASAQLFPQLADVKWEYEWGEYIAATADHYPHLHDLGNGIVAGLGYNGRAVALATAMGKVLADWASGMPSWDLVFQSAHCEKSPFIACIGSGSRPQWLVTN
tara:strand:+ start:4472 stop:5263 length:792 start_codon:yes stop_codon:yes gene_type:complete